ncbi:MAG: arginase [Anaerolinea sp.]|nr:arginase [Anaerolinea sp.]
MDLGQKRRGVDMGPSAIRYAGLQHRLENLGYQVSDGGNISVPVVEQIEPDPTDGRALNAHAVGAICQSVHEHMEQVLNAGQIGIFLGGDHSIALGTVSAALEHHRKVGVLWIDAHGDFNTPQTTPSGNVHGMVVAALMGKCPPVLTVGDVRLRADQIVYLGIRDLDIEEKAAMREAGVRVYTMRDIDENGMATVVHAALNALGNVDALHISLDMDALDPRHAPGVGTPVPGGLTYREAHLLLELLADDGRARTMDIVEVNPILDNNNRTARTAVELTASLFGQRIL